MLHLIHFLLATPLISTPTELAIQRIEDQTSLVLSRQISTPNIASKGKLAPRTVWVPTALIQSKTDVEPSVFNVEDKGMEAKADTKPLIQELSASGPPKGILKNVKGKAVMPVLVKAGERLAWNWTKRDDGRLEIIFDLPGLVCFFSLPTLSHIQYATDLRPHQRNATRHRGASHSTSSTWAPTP